ncbi:D-aspartate oxidase-like [Dendronephthya gigantea]|uniref:D-aspartate oxidase-like n=1 Tax=Dendronephthya gigantea TaxID=151771 RepID=UPI00106A0B27|nr:D-aspartate oxidase-like [Dendronephthya gigantea]
MSQLRRKKVAIIGAGIIGVSTAICLQDSDPSLELTIIADKFSPNTTSDGGAGLWSCHPGKWVKGSKPEKQRQWGEGTLHYLKSIIESDIECNFEMSYITGYFLYDHIMPEEPALQDIALYYKRLSRDELGKLGFSSDLIDGFTTTSVMFPGTPYLRIKLKQFQKNGGEVIKRKVKSFDEFAGKFDVVVNCTGVGARELCQDEEVVPTRGYILKMDAPWVRHFYYIHRKQELDAGLATYIFPRFKDVIVGGTAQRGNCNTTVNKKETQEILDKASEFEPTIKKANIMEEWVGLRPVRDHLRLEKEIIEVKTQYGSKSKLQVVHNYGHGGCGLSLFWGCAEEATKLVHSCLLHSGL